MFGLNYDIHCNIPTGNYLFKMNNSEKINSSSNYY